MTTELRDAVVMAASLCLAGYEIVFGGGRPSVLAFLGALLTAPIAIRIDRNRRNGNGANA